MSPMNQRFGVPPTLGPCRLEYPLGSGAAGTVYLATLEEDTDYATAGTRVAVKVLDPRHLQAENVVERFLREGDLGRAVNHPTVVRTYAVDSVAAEETQFHFLVLEFCEGRTLRELMRLLGPLPEALLRTVALQITSGLEAIHAAGATHRDLKPGNVLITEDDQVKLMDLGVAYVQAETSRLTRDGFFVGTLLYAAPEQIQGKPVGATADLYSLGVVLYEAATGTQPFEANSQQATIRRQLHHVPPAAGDLAPDLTPWLDDIIMKLIAKDPEERFSSALELRRILEEGEASSWWIQRLEEQALPTRVAQLQRLEVIAETPFVGRVRELQTLETLYRDAAKGRGRGVLIDGEAGVGKTRLLNELAVRLSDTGTDFHLLYGAAKDDAAKDGAARNQPAQDNPGKGCGALARSVVSYIGRKHLQDTLQRSLAATPQLIPGLVRWLDGEEAGESDRPLETHSLEIVFSYLASVLSQERPVLWIVEDLHRASSQELAIFGALSKAAPASSILLVGTRRPQEVQGKHRTPWEVPPVQHLELKRLSRRQVSGLLRNLLPTEIAAATLGRDLSARSAGNPLFIVEMIRELREKQLLHEEVEGGVYALTGELESVRVPEAVRHLLLTRLEGVGPDDRRLLDVAAVQGVLFDPGLVAATAGLGTLQVLEALARIEKETQVVRSSGPRYCFDHPQLQEIVYGLLAKKRRRRLHQTLAETMLSRRSAAAAGSAGEASMEATEETAFLAQHLLQGDAPEEGLPYCLPCLDFLTSQHRHETFLFVVHLALAACPENDPALLCDLRLRQLPILETRGLLADLRAAAENALSAARASRDPARLALAKNALAGVRADTGNVTAATQLLDEALEAARKSGNRSIIEEIRIHQALFVAQDGRPENAQAALEEVLERREGADAATVARIEALQGWIYLEAGREEDARQALETSSAALGRAGRLPEQALALLRLGNAHRCLGNSSSARGHLEQSLKIARASGAAAVALDALNGLGALALEEGDLDRAGGLVDLALRSAHNRRLPRQEGEALLLLAEAARARGDGGEAEQHYNDALALQHALGSSRGIARASFRLGRHYLEHRNPQAAEPLLSEAQTFVADQALATPGPLPMIYLALLRRRVAPNLLTPESPLLQVGSLAEDEAPPQGGPILERAEGHLLLRRLGYGDGHLALCRKLLGWRSRHLKDEALDRFWRYNPVARALRRQEPSKHQETTEE